MRLRVPLKISCFENIMSLSGLAGLVKCNCFQNKKLYQNDILAQEQNGW